MKLILVLVVFLLLGGLVVFTFMLLASFAATIAFIAAASVAGYLLVIAVTQNPILGLFGAVLGMVVAISYLAKLGNSERPKHLDSV